MKKVILVLSMLFIFVQNGFANNLEYKKGYNDGLHALKKDSLHYKNIIKKSIIAYKNARSNIDKAVAVDVLKASIQGSCKRLTYKNQNKNYDYYKGFYNGCIDGFNINNYK